MKTILSLVGLFLAVIIFGAFFGFCATLLFIHATDIVVGADGVRLDMNQILFLLFLWIGASAVVSSVFTVVYSIRYPKNGVARVITHTILCLLAWLVIIPLSLGFADKAGEIKPMQPIISDPMMASYIITPPSMRPQRPPTVSPSRWTAWTTPATSPGCWKTLL